MIVPQITNNANKLLARSLMCYCISRKCSFHFQACCKEESAYYFIHRRRFGIDAKSNKPNEVSIMPNGGSTRNSVVPVEQKFKTNYVPVTEYVKQFYLSPLTDLISIYAAVKKEFNKTCFSVTYETNKATKCIINITWPSEKSFSCVAPQKKTAAYFAGLQCLDWLYISKKIVGRKPVLYNAEQIANLLKAQESVDIKLKSDFKNEIELLINKFDNEIKPLMTSCAIEDSEIPEVLHDPWKHSLPESTYQLRAAQLKRNMSMRPNKTERLPLNNFRETILDCLQNNAVLLIKGDTGCGKSTQVPQIILDAYSEEYRGHECNIIVSEPRRVSAISLAQRVADERNEILGDVVGYHVRFNSIEPQTLGSILYCTTGMLLRKLQYEKFVKEISHVIIDEAHERSLQTDMALKLLKDIVKHNPHLKLIIMSATISAELFQQYFSCPVINVPGELHPVKMHFLEDISVCKFSNQDLLHGYIPYEQIVNLIEWIIDNKPPGGILCFLPGWHEIKTLHTLLSTRNRENMLIVALHSKLSNLNQQDIFRPVAEDVTKIILSTDIAETGITIKDVKYVIDTALKRDVIWDADRRISKLQLSRVSQANILQRKGRAGRMRPGESYHIIKEQEYRKLNLFPTADIFKLPLESAIVTSKMFTNETADVFFGDMPEPPSDKALNSSIKTLKKTGILDANENLTSLGKRVSLFSLSPLLSKAIILSAVFECWKPVTVIAAVFSTEVNSHILRDTKFSREMCLTRIHGTLHWSSDHIDVAKSYENLLISAHNPKLNKINKSYYVDVSIQNFERVYKLHMTTLLNSNFLSLSDTFGMGNTCGNCNELVRAVLFASTTHLIKRNMYGHKQGYFTGHANILVDENDVVVNIGKSSVNHNRKLWPSELLTYIHKMDYATRHSCEVFDTSIISPLSVLLFSRGEVQCKEMQNDVGENKNILIRIKDIKNINFRCDRETADLLLKLRDVLWNIVDFIIEYDGIYKEESLRLVYAYKHDLICMLSKMLEESAHDFDKQQDVNN